MSFVWPPMLLAILLVPLGIWVAAAIERRRRARLSLFGDLGIRSAPAGEGRSSLRRTVPAALVVTGLLVMAVALARPQAVIGVPQQFGTVVLAFDVSGSMAATDIKPSRIEAAKAAATAFVNRQPASVQIGVVAFSDGGISVQVPTTDQGQVLAAINRLSPQKGTSVGQGILVSLDAIDVALKGPKIDYYTNPPPSPTPTPTPVPAGTHAPAAIVLLSDGENNESPEPAAAAQVAANRGVRVFTVGVGSPGGATLDLNGFRVHTQLDEAGLKQIAQTTGGTYYAATDANQLSSIYANLDTQFVVKAQQTELTALFAGASVLLLVAGGMTALALVGRLP